MRPVRSNLGRVDASDWATSVIAVLALAVAGWSLFCSKRSVEVAERAAIAFERSAVAADALVPAPPPPVAWRLDWESNDGYNLRNAGLKPATGVKIEGLPAKSYRLGIR